MHRYYTDGKLNELGISHIANLILSQSEIPKDFLAYLDKNPDQQIEIDTLVDFLREESIIKPRKKTNLWFYAVAVIIIISLTVPFWFKTDSTKNFVINSEYEYLLGDQVRSGAFKFLSPVPSKVIQSDTIYFSWQTDEKSPFYINIFDNLGNEVANLYTDSVHYIYTHKLTNGLYYWKLETNDDLLYLGKFKILN